MTPILSSGTQLFISAELPLVYDQATFETLTFTQVKAMRSVGDVFSQHQTVENRTIGQKPYMQRVGELTSNLQIELYRIDNAGQTMLKEAAANTQMNSYSFKIVSPDSLIQYFTAAVTYRANGIGAQSSIAEGRYTLELDGDVIEV